MVCTMISVALFALLLWTVLPFRIMVAFATFACGVFCTTFGWIFGRLVRRAQIPTRVLTAGMLLFYGGSLLHGLDAGDFLPACLTNALAHTWLLTALVGSIFLAWRKQPHTPTFAVFASMGLMSPPRSTSEWPCHPPALCAASCSTCGECVASGAGHASACEV